MAELTICGAAYYGGVALLELRQGILEADELCRAYECEVLRVEEQNHILIASVLLKAEVALDDSIYHGVGRELRCFFSY